ncbi:trans-aconitate 2-methyltransferase [Jiella sp. MQZ9-1]|uniref:Trans-aconitate 2-methyltransferase n=1 Tax=Jiella flava TaxID=2816857 RepID=A0A939JX05_9HYPH|nr:trans-aconitate 2-methyltransferase [Jiella flava]MBO0663562.1 trans-aconitate 2-methyltransferase [Jiella flava]MCD2472137.1 trans-aconitate 2-methyltransferase [Jiella flava]
MTDWNADLYLRFADERTRPAAELLARVPLEVPARAVDLGCGPGNSTELIAQRYPAAKLEGIDTSQDMLAKARARLPQAQFTRGDVAAFQAEPPADLVFANAVLQWLPNHARLLPKLMASLAPGGVLAVQMPDNLDEPSHRLMRETAVEPRFAAKIGDADKIRARILTAEAYYDLLAPHAASIDIWRTTYCHVLPGPAAIIDWVRATGLRPFLDLLNSAEQTDFLAAYATRIAKAYPVRADGKALFAFPRLFIVAVRSSDQAR